MFDLRVEVVEVRGFCDLPHRPGDYFEVRRGRLFVPAGKFVCIWALGAMLPMLPAKERRVVEENDWLPRTELLTCPDPDGQVVWRVRAIRLVPASEGRGVRRLRVDRARCDGCGRCVEACPAVPPAIRLPGPAVCRQCGVAPCVEACPHGALRRDRATGAVLCEAGACEGCGTCAGACAFDAARIVAGKARICDLCGGRPRCVEVCATGALTWPD